MCKIFHLIFFPRIVKNSLISSDITYINVIQLCPWVLDDISILEFFFSSCVITEFLWLNKAKLTIKNRWHSGSVVHSWTTLVYIVLSLRLKPNARSLYKMLFVRRFSKLRLTSKILINEYYFSILLPIRRVILTKWLHLFQD